MLSSGNRLTSPADFREAVRRGRRCGGPMLVVHAQTPSGEATATPRVGLVVSRAVGSAVTRNRVKRRLRHLARERVATFPPGALVVVRALPAAAEASYADLGTELDRCLARCLTTPTATPAETVGAAR